MVDSTLIRILLWLFAVLGILQLFTIAVITLSYRWRRQKLSQSGYNFLLLDSIALPEAELKIYMDGVSLFADMEASIMQARSRILFETFIWKDDVLGRKFRDMLVKKAQEGVEVYVSYDLLGNGLLGSSYITFPRDIPTLHVKRYFAMKRLRHIFSPSRYNVSHRKVLIVDDDIGFVGGYNLGEIYRTQWRDTHLRVVGTEVNDLTYAFVDFWNHYLGQPNDLAYPKQKWLTMFDVCRNDPLRRNYPIRSFYLQAIERAQEHIYITNAYFVPDPAFRGALMDAARRGVDVQVILPWESNHLMVDWVARHWFSDYLKAGIQLFGYEAAMIHTKTVTIDGKWSMIGTANLDRLSLWLNHEINAVIHDDQVAQQMEEIFACDKAQTRSIGYEEWESRPLRARLGERILAPLWPIV